jgi:hypothetical protein
VQWSWDSVHLPEEVHAGRKVFVAFLDWLKVQVSGLPVQGHFTKKQLQQLLLGLGLTLRDHELACFTEHAENPLPPFLLDSCMEAADIEVINTTLDNFFDIIDDHVK